MKSDIKIGLALSGGAMRGLAHVGVLETLEEHKIPIHIVTGTSMGSLIGGLYASGRTPKFMRAFSESVTSQEERRYKDITIPRIGMIRGHKIEQMIYTLCGGKKIENLDLPYKAIACCIEDNKAVEFDKGDLTSAIRCSISIPGIFEPIVIDGKTYVDGGALERVPVSAARDMGADYVIAVDVNSRGGTNPTPNNIFDLLLTVFEMMEWQAMEHRTQDADVTILPSVKHINPASFKQAKECMDIGKASALEAIEQIKQDLSIMGYSF